MSNEKATIGDRASILQAEQNRACDAGLKEGRKDFVSYFLRGHVPGDGVGRR